MSLKKFFLLLALFIFSSITFAVDGFEPAHKVVIQVSDADPAVHRLAISNAVNIQKFYGIDNVRVELVAYGPGLKLLMKDNENAKRVSSLMQQEISFSACGNTMKTIERKTGKKSVMIEGIKVVPAGLSRLIELQEQGYAYVRP